MSHLSFPDRIYLLSDTFGGQHKWNPHSAPDIDAHLTTDIRSRFSGVRREFDIFGQEPIVDHVLRTATRLHDENKNIGATGIFVNYARRDLQGVNGEPFYLARIKDNLVVVATPVSVLSAIRSRITELSHLPNEGNELYGPTEQFRSSFSPQLLAANHGQRLVADPRSKIPEPQRGCKVSYVDRFGNLVIHEEGDPRLGDAIKEKIGGKIRLKIGEVFKSVHVGTSLKDAPPGALSIYGNDGHIEVIGKWSAGTQNSARVRASAYQQFRRPTLGTPVDCAI